ncbi:uncharacterized protein A1O9_09375 [Exophiala aquamarina CBS 119918]|uniref:Cytochrome P450 n=1 Tax=Exophiala aquamarina CBS 119918 TaxID=1182545 RepID=A0A072P5C9_9EURO|nr:uncharacterized protein A1O9_09375 [Exophiala aquamarina CBS 119918]KEF54932.1 hypothetical protein A1O9_09375 [Exophiala aquamarina CBS 119918]
MSLPRGQRENSLLQELITTAMGHPFIAAITAFATVCIATRVITALRYRATVGRNQSSSNNTRPVPLLSYWIPWLGHAVPFALGATEYLERLARPLGPEASAFGILMGGVKNNIVTSPSLARQILFDRHAPVNMDSFIFHVMRTVWDDQGTMRAMDPALLWGEIHAVLYTMLRESFVSHAIKGTVKNIQERTWNLVSGSRSYVDQSIWERAGKVEIISGSDSSGSKPFIAEASLHLLLRDFVGDIATLVLFGHNFLENNPTILSDLWEMDAKFNIFVTGAPSWWPGMAGPYKARERVVHAVEEHHIALLKHLDGEDPGTQYSDLSDVSDVIVDRLKAFRKAGTPPRGFATGNAAILWAMNANANQIIFWLIFYVYSDRTLLSEIRTEIAPYVRFVQPPDNGLPVKDAPQLDIDLDSLWHKCPLLKGAFFESLRLEAASSSFKMIGEDFIVTESEEDAKLLGKKAPESYFLPKGELICIPHGIHQNDQRYFRDPKRFDPRRFCEKTLPVTSSDDSNADVRVEYGTMKVWGGGKQMCKGKTFAEREVIVFAAAIIMQWDMVPLSNGGKWVHPGRKLGAGAYNPKNEFKVRLWRRDAW